MFCGDFNTCPSAPLYNLMKYGKLQYSEYTPDKISGFYKYLCFLFRVFNDTLLCILVRLCREFSKFPGKTLSKDTDECVIR